MTAIHLIIGTLQKMNVFGIENRDTLTHKATGVKNAFTLLNLDATAIHLTHKFHGLDPELLFCFLPVLCKAPKET